jgi:ubiquitin-like protein Pup
MTQQRNVSSGSSRGSNEGESPSLVSGAPLTSDSRVDDLLDEIDSLLEDNAEAFVKSFVQKGGQ